jgi:hypothetical protein
LSGYFPPGRDRLSSEEEEKVKILIILTFPSFLKEGCPDRNVGTGWLTLFF